ncbi:unnamed protein product [Paramecium primaurelia]|uniref:Uncharacterized protein n=1 Tax=Paramecium primaurelia TaxID=5886 RepID=A0A8S1KTY6_PARPR|nr:unnamed protein product [Paramecium primaurelia]
MKPQSQRSIKKKIKKHIIQIIILNEKNLSSPHNTNQYLLTKHTSCETSPETEVKEPGSMLSFLLNEERPQIYSSHSIISKSEQIITN